MGGLKNLAKQLVDREPPSGNDVAGIKCRIFAKHRDVVSRSINVQSSESWIDQQDHPSAGREPAEHLFLNLGECIVRRNHFANQIRRETQIASVCPEMPAERHLPHESVIAIHEATMFSHSNSSKASLPSEKRRFTPLSAHVGARRDLASYLAEVQLSVATLPRYAAAR